MSLVNQLIDQFIKYKPDIAVKNITYNFVTRERRSSFGKENADKTFYLIRSLRDTSPLYIGPRHNLLANYFYVLSHLAYARERGWIPVVDQLNYPVYNIMPEPVNGAENPWEYYWRQPSTYTLEDVYRSRNVVLSKQNWYGQWDMGYDVKNYYDAEKVSFFHTLSELVPLNTPTSAILEERKLQLFPTGEKILGVSVRMGGHAESAFLAAPGHPRQPEAAVVAGIVREKFEEWQMDRVFLASDSDSAVKVFEELFGDRLIVMPRLRCPEALEGKDDPEKPMYSPQNRENTTVNYLVEMELLAACHGLIASVSSGTRYALVRNNNSYEHLNILDFGVFPDSRVRKTNGER